MTEIAGFLNEIPWAIVLPLLIIELILLAVAVIDLIRIEETNGPKWMWFLIVIFLNLIGPIMYFIIGRSQD